MHQNRTDIPASSWVSRLPAWGQPYARLARLDRPIGTWLLFLPCLWGMGLAGAGTNFTLKHLWLVGLFAVGSLVMRGAGCVWNDITDRNFDGKVARTATRPIPAGEVTVTQALLFMGVLLLLGLAVLWQLNWMAQIIALCSLLFVLPYPFMKRFTWWPQAWLGLTFNWGALVGWAAMTEELTIPAFLLYGAGLFWTLGYDTIYAHQDKEDDALIGVKSTALRLGSASRLWIAGFYGMTILLLIAAVTGVGHGGHLPFWLFLLSGAAHLAWQVKLLDIDNPALSLRLFKSNRNFGLIVAVGLAVVEVGA